MAENHLLQVEVVSPETDIYQGPAIAVTSFNQKGRFDILPQHARFISIIEKQLIIHVDRKEKKTLDVEQGVLKNENNQVKVYLGF